MNALEISEPYNTLFKKYGLSSFNDFIDKPIGNLLADEATREIRKFDIEGQTFFLKRVKKFKLSSALEALLQGHKPYSYSYREMIHVQMLKKAGIAVMSVAAVGERRSFGFPKESFIIVVGIEGQELALLYKASDPAGKLEILKKLGALYAELHHKGFFKPIRLTDIIQSNTGELTLIDRETRHPYPRRFSHNRALNSFAQAIYRQRRQGIDFNATEIDNLLRAYYSHCKDLWTDTELIFLKKAQKVLR